MRRAFLLALSVLAPGAASAASIWGFNYPLWSADGYASASSSRDLADIAGTGAGWVALTPTLYQADSRASDPAPGPDTPSDAALRAAIRRAKSLGLKVALKPHVDSRAGGARAWIEPRDADAWFDAYRVHALRWARLAREERVDLFVVGTELALLSTPNHWKSWRTLIAQVRREYPGPLTYAANWHSVELVGFWRDLDYIGVDAYYPLAAGRNRTARALEWLPIEASLAALSLTAGRPILFTEFGLSSQRGAAARPWEWLEFGPADPVEQDDYVASFLNAFAGKSFVAGFLNWAWDPDPAHAGPADKSMSLRGKPALDTFRARFPGAAARRPPAIPPVPSNAAPAARAAAVLSGAAALGGRF